MAVTLKRADGKWSGKAKWNKNVTLNRTKISSNPFLSGFFPQRNAEESDVFKMVRDFFR